MNNNLLPNLIDENKVLVWNLILLNMNEVPIAVIQYENLGFTCKFDDYDELSFTVPRFLYDRFNKSTIDNKTWFTLRAGLKVRLDIFEQSGLIWKPVFSELFAIQQPTLSESRDSNSQQWSCVALHQLLFNKMKIRGYEDTRKLVEPNKVGQNGTTALTATPNIPYKPIADNQSTQTVEGTYKFNDNTNGGILDYVLEFILPDWSIAYYDEELLNIAQQGKLDFNYMCSLITITKNSWCNNNGGGVLLEQTNNLYHNSLRNYIRGTQENQYILDAEYQKYLENLFPFDHVSTTEEALEAIVGGSTPNEQESEALRGAMLVAKAENAIVTIQNWMRTLCDYTYNNDGNALLYGTSVTDTTGLLYKYKEVCRELLNNFIEPMSPFKSATGSVPYRSLKLDTTLVDMFKQLEQSYLCIFEFDNINKQIYIYSRENEVVNKIEPLIISPHIIMESVNYQASTDQIITRLYAKGKDDITLSGYNITGLNYIDNFQYYIDNKMMSKELENALIYYKWLIEDVRIYQDMVNAGKIITQSSSIAEYQAKIRELHGDTDWILTKNAQWLYEHFLINVEFYNGFANDMGNYYTGLSITDYNNTPNTSHRYTIKKLQEQIVKIDNNVSMSQKLARQFIITYHSQTPTDAEQNCEDSWWRLDEDSLLSRSAIASAVSNSVNEIQQELDAYLDYDLSNYYTGDDINRIAAIQTIWQSNDTPNNNFYLLANITQYSNALKNWQKQFQYENVEYELNGEKIFSQSLKNEMQNYIYEDDISWSTITSADSLCLYATEYLDYICKIPLTINLDTIDILSNYRYQFDWHKITDVGAKLYVEFEDFGLHYDLIKLMSYTYSISPTDSQIQLQFSNTYELQDLLNQVIADVWAYSYKQLQDISTYKTSWENFIAKEDTLILQGQQIQSDVSAIVNNAGNKVTTSKGLATSKVKYNALQYGVNGYYVRDKTLSSTKAGTKTKPGQNPQQLTANTKTIPDHIVFQDADVIYSTDSAGETTLTISNVGGGGGAGASAGLPRYYTAPYFSTELSVLDARKNPVVDTATTTTEEGGETITTTQYYVYYQRIKETNTGTKNVWYKARLIPQTGAEGEESANGYVIEQARDFSTLDNGQGRRLWWITNNNSGYMTTIAPTDADPTKRVMIYSIDAEYEIMTIEKNGQLPRIKWGLGTGNGDEGKLFIEKTTNGADVYIMTRQGQEEDPNPIDGSKNGDPLGSRARGIAIRDSGIYQIRNGTSSTKHSLAKIPIFHMGQNIQSCVTDATASGINVEKGDVFITTTSY